MIEEGSNSFHAVSTDAFCAKVLERELSFTNTPDNSNALYAEQCISMTGETYFDSRESTWHEVYAALRQRNMKESGAIYQYVRIGAEHKIDVSGKESLKILTLPFEKTQWPFYEALQCQLVNKDTCKLQISALDWEGRLKQIVYKVNLKNGHVIRSYKGISQHGASGISVWGNYIPWCKQFVEHPLSIDQFIHKHAQPRCWNDQLFAPQASRR